MKRDLLTPLFPLYRGLLWFLGYNPGPAKRAATITAGRNNISYLKITVEEDIKKTGLLK